MVMKVKLLQSLVLFGQAHHEGRVKLITSVFSFVPSQFQFYVPISSNRQVLLLKGGSWNRQCNDQKRTNRLGISDRFRQYSVGKSEYSRSQRSNITQSFAKSVPNRGVSTAQGSALRIPPWNAIFESDLKLARKRRNIKFFNKLIVDYGQRKRPQLSQRMFEAISRAGLEPNEFSWTCLINAYVRNGDVSHAELAFQGMSAAGINTGPPAYTAMIKALSNNGSISRCLSQAHFVEPTVLMPNCLSVPVDFGLRAVPSFRVGVPPHPPPAGGG